MRQILWMLLQAAIVIAVCVFNEKGPMPRIAPGAAIIIGLGLALAATMTAYWLADLRRRRRLRLKSRNVPAVIGDQLGRNDRRSFPTSSHRNTTIANESVE